MLPRRERLTRRRDFSAVYGRKKSWANTLLALYVRWHAPDGINAETRRFGFSVSKKVGKAHDRNGVKRRLREICRIVGKNPADDRETWRQGFDAVFVARSESAKVSYAALSRAVDELARRAKLLNAGATATLPLQSVSEKHQTEKTEGTGTAS